MGAIPSTAMCTVLTSDLKLFASTRSVKFICLPFLPLDQCNSPLGMENFQIPSEALRASRSTSYWEPYNGRINDSVTGWCANLVSDKEWFEIKFDTDHYVTAVANQATPRGWVLEFTLAYSRGLGWYDYMENGTIKVQCYFMLKQSFAGHAIGRRFVGKIMIT